MIEVPPLPDVPLVPDGTWTDVPGARVGVARGGIKKLPAVRDDVAVLVAPGTAAGLTTASTAASAPCCWSRARLPGRVHAVVVNSGNANAATGAQGEADVRATAAAVADALSCPPGEVLVFSTGVIGVPLPMDRLVPAARAAASDPSSDGHRLARAILTTDTRPKEALVRAGGFSVGGVAKGSGMIHPDMATMLAFVATDARVAPEPLQGLVAEVCDRTFHAITVDGDTSTSDALVVQATGRGDEARPGTETWEELAEALEAVCRHLAREIARDGEGATTLIEVAVIGTGSDADARRAARAVARSSLVKTAVHGRDPNWGRIVGALGAARVPSLEVLDVDIAGVAVMRGGRPLPFDEGVASAALRAPEVRISCRLPGPGIGRAWGCDLSDGYVRINADYRS